jgi:hypothetical protein
MGGLSSLWKSDPSYEEGLEPDGEQGVGGGIDHGTFASADARPDKDVDAAEVDKA